MPCLIDFLLRIKHRVRLASLWGSSKAPRWKFIHPPLNNRLTYELAGFKNARLGFSHYLARSLFCRKNPCSTYYLTYFCKKMSEQTFWFCFDLIVSWNSSKTMAGNSKLLTKIIVHTYLVHLQNLMIFFYWGDETFGAPPNLFVVLLYENWEFSECRLRWCHEVKQLKICNFIQKTWIFEKADLNLY